MLAEIYIPEGAIAELCERWQVQELALFGSALRDDFRPESDIDVLVTFMPGRRYRIRDLMTMERELEVILGRRIDLGTRQSVEEDPNYLRRKAILDSAQVIYHAG
jgi:hypothetical protein